MRVKVEIVIVQLQLKILKNFNYVLTIVICCYILYSDIIKDKSSNCQFISNSSLNNLNSISLALAGYDFFINNGTEKDLLPLYLRKPQAQRQLEEKTLLNNINKKEN